MEKKPVIHILFKESVDRAIKRWDKIISSKFPYQEKCNTSCSLCKTDDEVRKLAEDHLGYRLSVGISEESDYQLCPFCPVTILQDNHEPCINTGPYRKFIDVYHSNDIELLREKAVNVRDALKTIDSLVEYSDDIKYVLDNTEKRTAS